MNRFFKILFYGALVIGAFVFYLQRNDRVEVDAEEIHEYDLPTSDESIFSEEQYVLMESGNFHSIKIYGNYKVYLSNESSSKYRIGTEENTKNQLSSQIRDGVLIIRSGKKPFRNSSGIRLYIAAPEFRYIGVHGAVDLKSEEELESRELELSISGAGDVELELEVKDLDISISGAGDVELEGEAEEVQVSISGAGNIEAFGLKAENMKLSLSGAGKAEVYATDKLDIGLSGAGSVKYKGSPNVNKRVSGFGTIKRVD